MIVLLIITLILAGTVKGAIGSGVPLIVVPIFTVFFDIQTAIVILMVPNLLSNIWQAWHYRRLLLPMRFLLFFSFSGGVGVMFGTWALVRIEEAILSIAVAITILLYLMLRVSRRQARLGLGLASKLVVPTGLLGGFLQGAVGMSGPVSVTFLNFMRLKRKTFIGSISFFFTAITIVQFPALISMGVVTWKLAMASFFAFAVISLSMPMGGRLGKKLSREWFDTLVMLLLLVIALRILIEELIF